MTRIATSLLVLLTAGCAAVQRAPAETPPPPQVAAPAAAAKSAAPAPTKSAEPAIARSAASAAKAPADKTPAAKTPAAAKAPSAPAAPEKVAGPPPLDLKTLEQQLKETRAIGVMTKLSIKNQVDDLIDQFRAYYQGTVKVPLEELRHKYDLLVMKVLALLQDGDQALAKAVASSREAIWGILADRNKFAKL